MRIQIITPTTSSKTSRKPLPACLAATSGKISWVLPKYVTCPFAEISAIAGRMVIEGTVYRNRPNWCVGAEDICVIFGELESLRRFKDDASEVRAGMECGIGVTLATTSRLATRSKFSRRFRLPCASTHALQGPRRVWACKCPAPLTLKRNARSGFVRPGVLLFRPHGFHRVAATGNKTWQKNTAVPNVSAIRCSASWLNWIRREVKGLARWSTISLPLK